MNVHVFLGFWTKSSGITDELLRKDFDVNIMTKKGETALSLAMKSRNTTLVGMLLDARPDLDVNSVYNGTANNYDLGPSLLAWAVHMKNLSLVEGLMMR